MNFLSAQDNCERITQQVLNSLTINLTTNDFAKIKSETDSIRKYCTTNELPHRIEILIEIIKQQKPLAKINDYIRNKYHDDLIDRYDDAARNNYNDVYESNKAKYHYVSLKHPIDSYP